MPLITETHTNRPVWFDLSTTDIEAAKDFYAALFDWKYLDSGAEMGHYTMAFVDGEPAAAVAPKQPGYENTPVCWTIYFGTDNATDAAQRIKDAGGSMMFEPMPVPDVGTMAIAMDPDGAAFGIWQAGTFPGARIEGEHGAMAWCEVNSKHAAQNAAFYARVFDLTSKRMDGSPTEYYTMDSATAGPVAGALQMDADWGEIPPHWMPYFAVAKLADADAVVKAHGGKLLHGPIPSPYGNIMVAQDPQGAVFSYISEH
ncbi:MAG: VOC family protein [Gemmatimonadaceae bacterium]|nr:VOC family protein [Gemmatimonadaceae bacterium]MCC6431677.1 VOC family protein [Gemmatimonadaceae bacterium]